MPHLVGIISPVRRVMASAATTAHEWDDLSVARHSEKAQMARVGLKVKLPERVRPFHVPICWQALLQHVALPCAKQFAQISTPDPAPRRTKHTVGKCLVTFEAIRRHLLAEGTKIALEMAEPLLRGMQAWPAEVLKLCGPAKEELEHALHAIIRHQGRLPVMKLQLGFCRIDLASQPRDGYLVVDAVSPEDRKSHVIEVWQRRLILNEIA